MRPSLPPPIKQIKDDNCALACLRSLLAREGFEVTEESLEPLADKQEWGVDIEPLGNAARHFGFHVEIVQLTLDALARYLAQGTFPIVYLNRVHLDRRFPVPRRTALRTFIPHAVIPVHSGTKFVTFNDPLEGKRVRRSTRKFAAAQADLGRWCVVCQLAES